MSVKERVITKLKLTFLKTSSSRIIVEEVSLGYTRIGTRFDETVKNGWTRGSRGISHYRV